MARSSIDYGKFLYEYFSEIHNDWIYGKNYTVGELKEELRKKVRKGSPKKIDISKEKPDTFNTQPLLYIINEKSRQNFQIKHPRYEDRYDLFYYPNNDKTLVLNDRIIRKLNKKNPPKGIFAYWGSTQNPPKKKGILSEVIFL